MSERIRDLVSRFNNRTERFKERSIQPPTPSSDEYEGDKSGEHDTPYTQDRSGEHRHPIHRINQVSMWGQASVLAVFGRVRHLTRGRPLSGTATANPRGQTRSTHLLATQPAGQTDVSVLTPQSKPRGRSRRVPHSITIHLSQCTAL